MLILPPTRCKGLLVLCYDPVTSSASWTVMALVQQALHHPTPLSVSCFIQQPQQWDCYCDAADQFEGPPSFEICCLVYAILSWPCKINGKSMTC